MCSSAFGFYLLNSTGLLQQFDIRPAKWVQVAGMLYRMHAADACCMMYRAARLMRAIEAGECQTLLNWQQCMPLTCSPLIVLQATGMSLTTTAFMWVCWPVASTAAIIAVLHGLDMCPC
jgi:hypothetical protein